ncbi:hypothetical protein ACIBQ1_59855 [Nonomuraea sp. NPDC050153]|uniref:hypothetical protein n=1 Tax=Nonomuraea sp. NPDC050153 TaxID=3364359 RepID=UPI0037A334E4
MPVMRLRGFDETLAQASPDVLREMIVRMAQMMMDAEAEQRCGAGCAPGTGPAGLPVVRKKFWSDFADLH